MDLTRLTTPAAAWAHLLTAESDDARDRLRPLERGSPPVTVRFVRGRKATDLAGFYTELAAALQFPDYFGENWDATNDCLTDLRWLPDGGLVLGLLDGDQLLSAAGDEAGRHLVKVLTAAANHWSKPAGKRAARPFHVVVQARPADADAVMRRWKALGLALKGTK